eukprot:gnl/TRDRNA2_/TRDRNA2_135866_c0_seq1.p1 gnl/TRDRNA2_/TRDRNA2_135866_c0~~gnl/TRDRNA2_/TRDRNA2_135866_c0_seq1.p1  ORF type:complete len:205 (-),score=3.07 gnl/TRDRNA2_/TRDRNA2_135866_c0_seq1:157-771(-)
MAVAAEGLTLVGGRLTTTKWQSLAAGEANDQCTDDSAPDAGSLAPNSARLSPWERCEARCATPRSHYKHQVPIGHLGPGTPRSRPHTAHVNERRELRHREEYYMSLLHKLETKTDAGCVSGSELPWRPPARGALSARGSHARRDMHPQDNVHGFPFTSKFNPGPGHYMYHHKDFCQKDGPSPAPPQCRPRSALRSVMRSTLRAH